MLLKARYQVVDASTVGYGLEFGESRLQSTTTQPRVTHELLQVIGSAP